MCHYCYGTLYRYNKTLQNGPKLLFLVLILEIRVEIAYENNESFKKCVNPIVNELFCPETFADFLPERGRIENLLYKTIFRRVQTSFSAKVDILV